MVLGDLGACVAALEVVLGNLGVLLGDLGVVLGRSLSSLEWSWAVLGRTRPSRRGLGRSRGCLGRSWGDLASFWLHSGCRKKVFVMDIVLREQIRHFLQR